MNKKMSGLSDEDLARLLAEVLDDTEPVPVVALQVAYSAVEMDHLSEELAALVFDSHGPGSLVPMRETETEARLLSFVNDHLSLDLELHADGQTIVGQISPPVDALLEVESGDRPATVVPTDEFGRFRVALPAGAAARLRVVGVLVTPWITR